MYSQMYIISWDNCTYKVILCSCTLTYILHKATLKSSVARYIRKYKSLWCSTGGREVFGMKSEGSGRLTAEKPKENCVSAGVSIDERRPDRAVNKTGCFLWKEERGVEREREAGGLMRAKDNASVMKEWKKSLGCDSELEAEIDAGVNLESERRGKIRPLALIARLCIGYNVVLGPQRERAHGT